MRTRSEDLLSSRDDEPMDAAARARVEADADGAAELARLHAIGHALRSLPELAPPPDAWNRIAAAAPRARTRSRRRLLTVWSAALAAGTAAAALLLTMELPMNEPPLDHSPISAERVAERNMIAAAASDGNGNGSRAQNPLTPAAEPNTLSAVSFAALLEESLRLERLLAEVPYQRPVMTVGTASTIALLEDRISDIDGQLSYGAAEGLDVPQQQALWRDRVDVMNALVQVRFAQARRFVY